MVDISDDLQETFGVKLMTLLLEKFNIYISSIFNLKVFCWKSWKVINESKINILLR